MNISMGKTGYEFKVDGILRTTASSYHLGRTLVQWPATPPKLVYIGRPTQEAMSVTLEVPGLAEYDCSFKSKSPTLCTDAGADACPTGQYCECREDCKGNWGPLNYNTDDAYCSGGGKRFRPDVIGLDTPGFVTIDTTTTNMIAVVQSGDEITVSRPLEGKLYPFTFDMQIACPPKASSSITTSTHKICTVSPLGLGTFDKENGLIGGYVRLSTNDDTCTPSATLTYMPNLPVQFTSAPDMELTQIFSHKNAILADVVTRTPGSSFSLKELSSQCTIKIKNTKSYMGITSKSGKITYYMYDRRLRLLQNTLNSPADVASSNNPNAQCPTVVRNFVNEKSCVRRSKGTCAVPSFLSSFFSLTTEMMRFWFTASQRHVLELRGMRLANSAEYNVAPCTTGLTTRWIKSNCLSLELSSPKMDDGTARVIIAALGKETGEIRDIKVMDYVAGNGGVCNTNTNTAGRVRTSLPPARRFGLHVAIVCLSWSGVGGKGCSRV